MSNGSTQSERSTQTNRRTHADHIRLFKWMLANKEKIEKGALHRGQVADLAHKDLGIAFSENSIRDTAKEVGIRLAYRARVGRSGTSGFGGFAVHVRRELNEKQYRIEMLEYALTLVYRRLGEKVPDGFEPRFTRPSAPPPVTSGDSGDDNA